MNFATGIMRQPCPSSPKRIAAISARVMWLENIQDTRPGAEIAGKTHPRSRPGARRRPNSSCNSRKAHSTGLSSGSAPPPGRSQYPG